MPSVETEEEIMFFDTDCGGVVHNIAYLRFIRDRPHPTGSQTRARSQKHVRNPTFSRSGPN